MDNPESIINALNHGDTPAADLAVPQGSAELPLFPMGPNPINLNMHPDAPDTIDLENAHVAPATELTGFIPAEPKTEAEVDSYHEM